MYRFLSLITMGDDHLFKRFPHYGDSSGFGFSDNGKTKKAQLALKGRSHWGKGGFIRGNSFVYRMLICAAIAYFIADAMLHGSMVMFLRPAEVSSGDYRATLEEKPNLATLRTSDIAEAVRFVPHKLLQKFRDKNAETNLTGLQNRRRIPIRPARLALVCAELSRSPGALLLLSVAKALQALGYVLELYAIEDGPVRSAWEKIGTIVNILQSNSHQQFQVDWLNFDGVVVSSLEAKVTISSLMQEPFRMVPVIWIIHEDTLGKRLRIYASDTHRTIISDWKSAFDRANVVVFSDYAMAMMYSVFDSGNFFVIPGSPKETWEVEHFMALNRKEDLLSKLSFKPDDFVIVVVGSQFSYTGIWREHALVMQATLHLMAKFKMNDSIGTSLRLVIVSNNFNSTYGVALQTVALQLGFRTGIVQHASQDDDVNILLSTADLVVYGSFHEEQAFPAILIRAMSFEKPIIVPKLPIIQKYIEDGIHGLLFPVGNIQMITEAMSLAITNGRLSVLARKIASAGRLHARDLMVSDVIEGYSTILENVLYFPSEVGIPRHVSEIPWAIKGPWQWQLMGKPIPSISDAEYNKQPLKRSSVVFQVEEFWRKGPRTEDSMLNNSSIKEDSFYFIDWKQEKAIQMAEDTERREQEELEDRREWLKRTWEEVYRSVKRAERTKGELHERDDGELERTFQPLCIYEPYYGSGTWPFLHNRSLYRGIGLSTKGRRPGADDIDASARLPLLNDVYYRDSLCEYGAFFAIANRVDRIHKNSWIGFQSWRAAGRKVSLSEAGEKALTDTVGTGKHGDAIYFWARLDNDTRAGTGTETFSRQKGFWSYCDAINAGNCRVVFLDAFKRMYSLPESWMAVPPMPIDGDSWSVLHSWAMPTRSFLEFVMFARMFIDAMDTQHYNEHHNNGECCLSISKDPHCYCRLLELLVNVWAYHSARRMIYVNPETGHMQEHHKLKSRRGNMWVKWFDFTLLKSMDEDMAEEVDTEHPTKRWLWPSTGEVYWQGVYERERHRRNRLRIEKKRKSKDKLVRMRHRYRQKSLGKYVKPPPEEQIPLPINVTSPT